MGLFVEFYDKTGDLFTRTPEVDYEYQAEQWVIEGLKIEEVKTMKAFYGPKPSHTQIKHDRHLFADWVVIETTEGRELNRLK